MEPQFGNTTDTTEQPPRLGLAEIQALKLEQGTGFSLPLSLSLSFVCFLFAV